MGKQIVYESRPTGPRSAKVAWSYFESNHGRPPRRMSFDVEKREWVGIYDDTEVRIPTDTGSGGPAS
jgi:hypothetical protein